MSVDEDNPGCNVTKINWKNNTVLCNFIAKNEKEISGYSEREKYKIQRRKMQSETNLCNPNF
jgi:hypothetical protein